MLAEENKNSGTSALEGKEVLQCLCPSLAAAISLDQKRKRKKEKRDALGFEMQVSLQ